MILAYHGTHGEGGGPGPVAAILVLGVFVTVGWLLFSNLTFRTTVVSAVGGWLAALALLFVL